MKDITTEEAIKILEELSTFYDVKLENGDVAIEKVLDELEKKDKIIKLMIKHLCNVIDNDSDASLLPFYDSDDDLEEKVKKYFERRAEDD